MIDLPSIEQCFIDLGWGPNWREDDVAVSIFKQMKAAHDFIQPDHIVLDISAGEAKYRPMYDHGHYVAFDSQVGDSRWDYSKLDIVGDAMHMPIRNSSIDVALNFTSLEHYYDPFAFFSEVARVLRPGGKLFLFVPHFGQEHQQPYDFYRYTQFALKDLTLRNGLEAEVVEPAGSAFFTATKMIDYLLLSINALGPNPHIVTYLEQTKTSLMALSRQVDAALLANPAARAVISQLPVQYVLVAKKPGELSRRPLPDSRLGILNEILADPFEKKPIFWDGVSDSVQPQASSRKYPVINGIPRFM